MLKSTTRNLIQYMLRDQSSFIILDINKSSPAQNITFLQSNLQSFPTILRQTIDGARFQSGCVQNLNAYINQVQRLSGKLSDIRSKQISPSILQDGDIISLSKTYQSIKDSISQQSQIVLNENSQGNLKKLIFVTLSLNILDQKLWSRLIKTFISQYKSFSIEDKNQIFQMLLIYLSKYSYISTEKITGHKFVMRQTHLRDLFDFDYFLEKTKETDLLKKLFNKQLYNALKLVQNRISLIEKVSKSSNFNYHSIRKQFESYMPEIGANIDFFKLNNLIEIYSFYQKIYLNPKHFTDKIQAQILKIINQTEFPEKVKISISKKLIRIWSFSEKLNKEIYTKLIEPTISNALKSDKQNVNFWINFTYNLICTDLGQEKFINELLDKIHSFDKLKYSKNGTYRIIKSYLQLKELKKRKSFEQIIKERQKELKSNIQLEKSKIGKQPIEFSSSEQFWRFVLKNIIPQEDMHSSIYIEQYQIDLFVKYKNCYFAIESVGSYKISDKNNKLYGKYRIKDQIIRSYGINVIQLSNLNFQHKMFMRFNLINKAQQYILGIMDKICQQNLSKTETKSHP